MLKDKAWYTVEFGEHEDCLDVQQFPQDRKTEAVTFFREMQQGRAICRFLAVRAIRNPR